MTAVERLVLGCALFGGLGSLHEVGNQGVTRGEAFELMDAAWDLGIRRFDTADAYGGGRSEEWIGQWRARSGNDVRVTTKTFNPMYPGDDRGLAPSRVRRQIAASLDRLGVEAVDLYLAHEWDPDVSPAEIVGSFVDLVDDGLARGFGFSNIAAGELDSAMSLATPSVVQNSYSLLRRTDELDVIPICADNGIAYEAYSPLAGGWLTGKYRAGEPMPAGSRMALAPQWYTHIDPTVATRTVDELSRRAADRGMSTAALALAWVLHAPGVERVVVGPKRLEHFDPIVSACSASLTAGEVSELSGLFSASRA